MSVLIKGMKMPEKCGSCCLFHVELPMHCTVVKGHKTVGAPYGMRRPDWCPLVEVYEPHGDLIDRSRFDPDSDYEDGDFWAVSVAQIKLMPPVIEAELGEDE